LFDKVQQWSTFRNSKGVKISLSDHEALAATFQISANSDSRYNDNQYNNDGRKGNFRKSNYRHNDFRQLS
jgi:hypothetical protein